ncbi:hypothetical protein [Pseudomonas fluorescens]|jgi:hypothetical protein|uniref:DUF4347 domain-containing protein n=1 Tax=Pseudomonas fluorescens TaxID=294 RepID=A0A5E7U5V2_PSEFL|nr:hypothetical protein [Pseudomonas fluorescens]VVQ06311.1 hypothetical protein PS941_03121 [Pseudomonas fluorescens]
MKDTLLTYIDDDGKKAAKKLWAKHAGICELIAPTNLKWRDSFGGMLIIIGHGSTMVKMGRHMGLHDMIGNCGSCFIVLAACEVGETHTSIGELQPIAQGLANLRPDAIVWGTSRDLPQQAVSDGTCFYKSPLFNWLQPANDHFPGLWKQFKKQGDFEAVMSMMPNLGFGTL